MSYHLGYKLGRWDDFESLMYILIYLLHGGLPWQGLVSHDLIAQAKLEISIEEFCFGLLGKYTTLLSYSHALAFNTRPNYDYLSRLFTYPVLQKGVQDDTVFGWNPVSQNQLDTPHIKSPPPMKTSHTCSSSTTPIHWTGLAHTTSPFTSHWYSEQASLTINVLGHCILYTNFKRYAADRFYTQCQLLELELYRPSPPPYLKFPWLLGPNSVLGGARKSAHTRFWKASATVTTCESRLPHVAANRKIVHYK